MKAEGGNLIRLRRGLRRDKNLKRGKGPKKGWGQMFFEILQLGNGGREG
jgi:hypothetical protein